MVENVANAKPSLKKIGSIRGRKSHSVSQESLIKTSQIQPNQPLPLVIEPTMDGVSIISWVKNNRDFVDQSLLLHGGILFRNWQIASIEEFEHFSQVSAGELLDYTYRSTPRSEVSGKVYSSTEYPADQSIPLHNEMAYTRTWPLRIAFYSVTTAATGGETPIAHSKNVYDHLDPEIRERFAIKQVRYVRNYGGGLDLPWQDVFQTEDKLAVEAFCKEANIEFAWKENDRLRTTQICQAVAKHPQTGDMLWFNQAHLFHVTSLKPEIRDRFLDEFAPEDLPRNTYYGDGSPIEPEALEAIRAAFDRATITFAWQTGDILLLDNMQVAHGRNPYSGQRKVVVAMAGSMSIEALET